MKLSALTRISAFACATDLNSPIKSATLACLVLAFLSCAAAGMHAQGLLTDQSLQPPPLIAGESYHYSAAIGTLLPMTGQEFTPSMSGLDFVDVNLYGTAANDTFQIAIHEGTITAPVLGLSDPLISSTRGFPKNEAQFLFSDMVPLTPGDLYVLEIIQVGSYGGWGVEIPSSATVNGQPVNMNYPGGRLIYNGVPQDNSDLIFREGIVVPEPGFQTLFCLCIAIYSLIIRARSINVTKVPLQ